MIFKNQKDAIAHFYGLRRRRFGLEPDFLLTRRIVAAAHARNKTISNTHTHSGVAQDAAK